MTEKMSERFPRSYRVLEQGVAEGVAPGFVAGIWQQSEPESFETAAVGLRRLALKGLSALSMESRTVFDLASVTKVFSTATLAGVLVDRGWLSWETPLQSLLPEYRYPDILLKHLLSHTAGLPAWGPLWEKMRKHFLPRPLHLVSVSDRQKEMRKLVFALKPEKPPGQVTLYSDISFLLLGFALEEVTQMPLDQAVSAFVWKPMGLHGAFYNRTTIEVSRARREDVAATEDCPWRGGILQGQVHDDNCWAMGGYAGHAGAFASAQDVLRFSAKLMTGFLRPKTLQEMWTRMPMPVGCERTLGWDTPSGAEPAFTNHFSPRSVGHLGYTGTSLWIDPERGLAVTLLSNRVHPTRENSLIKAFRSRFHEALWHDLDSNA